MSGVGPNCFLISMTVHVENEVLTTQETIDTNKSLVMITNFQNTRLKLGKYFCTTKIYQNIINHSFLWFVCTVNLDSL